MTAWSGEKIAFTFAALVAAGSTIIFANGAALEKAEVKPIPPYVAGPSREETAEETETADSGWSGVPWLLPTAWSRDDAWNYELFGPPEIHDDASAEQLMVASPDRESGGVDEIVPGGPERMATPRVPFRLQLVGHFGEGEEATGTFANLKTGETFLARAGREVPDLGLTITKFKVVRQPVAIPDSMTTVEAVAAAEVLDPASGEVTVLTDREWVYVEPATIPPAEKLEPVLTP
ncbi:MAG: hypothetical protein IPN11_03245 [Opitutaceae bacterium]|nr:hypothetical protein [Opitutaceae bacterium]